MANTSLETDDQEMEAKATAKVSDAPAPSRTDRSSQQTNVACGSDAAPSGQQHRTTLVGEIVKYSISLLILGFGIFVMMTMYGFRKPPAEQESKELIPMVQTVPVVPYAGQLDKTVSGTVVPFREIRVAAEISGNVVAKFDAFEAGNFVKKGTKLIEIDPTDYQMELDTGLAEVDQTEKMLQETMKEIAGAKRNVANAQSDYKLAKTDHQRNLRIKNALSSSELGQSKRQLLAAQTALTTCENNLEMMEAKLVRMKSTLALTKTQLSRAKTNLKRTIIVAPDDGVIVREMVQEGDFVRAGDSLVMFEDTSRSEVLCNLTPTDLAWIRDNSVVNKEFEDEQEKETFSPYYLPKTKVSIFETTDKSVVWQGVLERYDGIGRDEATRTIPVRITIKDPVIETSQGQRALVRGMYVKCKIEVQTSTDDSERSFLKFPAVALRPGNYVWAVDDKKLRRVEVEVVDFGEQLIDDEMTKIVVVAMAPNSLKSGDEIVASPIPQPEEGKEVVLKSDMDSKESDSSSTVGL